MQTYYTERTLETELPITDAAARDRTRWPALFARLRDDLDALAAVRFPDGLVLEYRLIPPRWGEIPLDPPAAAPDQWWIRARAKVLVAYERALGEG